MAGKAGEGRSENAPSVEQHMSMGAAGRPNNRSKKIYTQGHAMKARKMILRADKIRSYHPHPHQRSLSH